MAQAYYGLDRKSTQHHPKSKDLLLKVPYLAPNAQYRGVTAHFFLTTPDTGEHHEASTEIDRRAIGFADRKSVVSGKSVSVRVDLGGRRIIKKKKKHTQQT